MASGEKLWKSIQMLKAEGHLIVPHMKLAKLYWEIDCRMWATAEEIECLADGVYSFSEFEEAYISAAPRNDRRYQVSHCFENACANPSEPRVRGSTQPLLEAATTGR